MSERITFRFSDIDMEKLTQLLAEVGPSHTQILRDVLKERWLKQLENFPQPLQIVTETGLVKNKAAVAFESAQEKLDMALDYERKLQLRQTEIDILSEKLTELRLAGALTAPQQEDEEKEASFLLAFWKSTAAKPNLFGFSVDLKALTSETLQILRDRTRPIELGISKPPRKK